MENVGRFRKENLVTKITAEGLLLQTISTQTTRFYIQHKIKKQGNPVRPEVDH